VQTLGGLAAGAALAYWFDPERGARRRAEVKQKALHATKEVAEAAEVTATDMANRGLGLWARLRAKLREGCALAQADDDVVIAERVRSKLGRVCSHPSAIEVDVKDGRVQLKGPILKDELQQVLHRVSKVRGVREIDNHLEPHETPNGVAGLQGGTRRIERPEFLQENWAPTWRVVMGAVGTALAAWGLKPRNVVRTAAGITGVGLVLRSLTNLPLKRLVGVGAGRRAIDIRKDSNVYAPVEEVFAFFSQFENFPKFMRHVREVVSLGQGRWRWSVDGPAGVPISWDAEFTQCIPNKLIAWRSVEGSIVGTAGIVRFDPERRGTRIDIRLSYNPPGGAIGHAFASLFGANPKKELDDDMMRLKSLIEVGKATGRKETVTREEIARATASNVCR
jgi:uncharacterized membrane protein